MTSRLGIGELARLTGTRPTTIRWYEAEGLLPPPDRTAGGHRSYGTRHRDRLRFLRRARALGFDLRQVRALLELAEHPNQPCVDAHRLAAENLAVVEEKLAALRALRTALRGIVAADCDTAAAECRVLSALSEAERQH